MVDFPRGYNILAQKNDPYSTMHVASMGEKYYVTPVDLHDMTVDVCASIKDPEIIRPVIL